MGAAQILDSITALLRNGCPKVPSDANHRLVAFSAPRGLAQIWFRTRGCRYRVQGGGCTVCDYGVSSCPTAGMMAESVAAAISELPFEPRTLVLSASGSFLDPWEVSEEARTAILELVARRLPTTRAILETHASTVTEDALTSCLNALGPRPWGIEMGLECAEPAILSHCLNKHLTLDSFRRALSVIASYHDVSTSANVLVGLPLLSPGESVECALMTLQWAFRHRVGNCVLFPVNVRPHTLAYWLCAQGLWQRPSLWNLVDVLTRLPLSVLNRVDIAWYSPAKQASPSPVDIDAAPRTCPQCYDRVVSLLGRYADATSRNDVCREMSELDCTCRSQWESQRHSARSLPDRVLEAYGVATTALLGDKMWQEERIQVREELAILEGTGHALSR